MNKLGSGPAGGNRAALGEGWGHRIERLHSGSTEMPRRWTVRSVLQVRKYPPAAAFSRPPNTQRLAHYVRHPAGQIAADFTLAVFNQHVERLPLVLSPENGS